MEQEKQTQSPKEEAYDLLVKALGERVRPERKAAPNPEDAIDLIQLLMVLKAKIVWIVIAAVLGGVIALFCTEQFITPMYQASIQMIVNAKEAEYGTMRSVSEVTSAENLVATYATVIKSNRVMEQTVKELNLDMSWRTLNKMVTVSPVSSTPVVNLVVTADDPEFCRQVVTTISQIAPELIVEAVEAGSCKVISDADCTGDPISPNVQKNVTFGIVVGAVLCSGWIVLMHLLNDSIRSESQLEELSPMPVLSTIPVAGGRDRRYGYGYGYGYGYDKKRKKEKGQTDGTQEK